MNLKSSDNYISNRAWFRDTVGGENLILCHTSALEYLELFSGYVGEKEIDVYSRERGQYENINYHIVTDFDDIDYELYGNVMCSTFNQTVNDMLLDKNCDETALCEALSNYFFSNNNSFAGLKIINENIERFNVLKNYASKYYNGG